MRYGIDVDLGIIARNDGPMGNQGKSSIVLHGEVHDLVLRRNNVSRSLHEMNRIIPFGNEVVYTDHLCPVQNGNDTVDTGAQRLAVLSEPFHNNGLALLRTYETSPKQFDAANGNNQDKHHEHNPVECLHHFRF